MQRRIAPDGGRGLPPAPAAEDSPRKGFDLGVDPLDLGQPDPVQLLGRGVERGVHPHQLPVRRDAAGEVAHAGAVVRACRGPDLLRQHVVQAGERRADLVADSGLDAGHRDHERPLGVRSRQLVSQDVDHPVDGGAAGHEPVREAAPQVGDVVVHEGGHRAPPLEQGLAVGRRPRRLVVGGVEELDRDAVERVHVPGHDPAVEQRELLLDRLPERRPGDRVAGRGSVGSGRGRRVSRAGRRVWPGVGQSRPERPAGRPASGPGAGRRTPARRARWRAGAPSRDRPARSRRPASQGRWWSRCSSSAPIVVAGSRSAPGQRRQGPSLTPAVRPTAGSTSFQTGAGASA